MVDITFSQSVHGSLRLARHEGLEGGQDPVLCLPLALNVGDISEPHPGPLRRRALAELMAPADGLCQAEHWADKYMAQAEESLAVILDRAAGGELLRIWYDPNTPADLCGLCWLMERLEALPQAHITTVPLPRGIQRPDGVVEVYRGWGEVDPTLYGKCSALAETPSRPLRLAWAATWQAMREENAPLRTVIEGRLVSVPADFYDLFLRRELEKQPAEFSEAWLIGDTLSRHQLHTGDGLLAGRVEAMIRAGELEPLTTPAEGEPLYRRRLRKRG